MNDTVKKGKFLSGLVFLVVLVLLLGLIISTVKRVGVPNIDPSAYQSVFLDNNQQYFGHLKNINTKFPYLSDIYYVRAGQATNNNPTLVKLGSELHGPEDVMYLNWSKVVFWENLRPDSQVVQGIAQEKAQRANAASQPQAAQQPVMPVQPSVAPTPVPVQPTVPAVQPQPAQAPAVPPAK